MALAASIVTLVMEIATTIVASIYVIFEHAIQLPIQRGIEIKILCPNTLTLFQD
jgi:hypothetical protein